MSKDSHIRAYIIGFILSLVFTAIPYYLVVTHLVQGNLLLGTILGFALLQMLIQVIFFLHLGRNPKLYWQLGFFVATFGAVLVVVVGSLVIISHLHHNMMPKDITDKIANDEAVHEVGGEQVGTCPGGGAVHMIELKNDTANPRHTDAKLCDTIIIYNADGEARDIEYGVHEKHETYAGQSGSTLRPGQNMVLTLTELGTHKFHDHLLDDISGDFSVKQ
jgi:cytochrome o ubiquinol oxidase operon protein cyoD